MKQFPTMNKLTVLFEIRLTETNPAPPIMHAFSISTALNSADMKKQYNWGVEAMKKQYKNHKHFKRLAVLEDKSHLLQVTGIIPAPDNATEIE